MIHHLKFSLPRREPFFPQHTLSIRLDLREIELIHDPRDGQPELDIGDRLSDTATRANGERRVGISGSLDGVFGGVFREPALGDE